MRRAATRTPRRRARRLTASSSLQNVWLAKRGAPAPPFLTDELGSFGTRLHDLALLLWADRRRPLNSRVVRAYWLNTTDWLESRLERWFGCRDFVVTHDYRINPRMRRYRNVRYAYKQGVLHVLDLDSLRFVRAHCAEFVHRQLRQDWGESGRDSRAVTALWFTA
jgi:hypothetical protein